MTGRRVLATAAAVVVAIVLGASHPATGAATNRAGVVVRYDDRSVQRMCVAFDEPSISGLELLERADVPFVAERSSVGSAICRIGERGCGQDDCFCEYPTFWGYWTRAADDDEWTFADVGAADRDVRNGDMDAWSWGENGEPAPDDIDFGDVCSASARNVQATSRTDAPPDATSARPNYAPFAGLVLLLALATVVLVRRRRRA